MAVEAPVRTPQRSTEDRDHDDRPWQVIVLNDNHNTFEGVAFALSHTLPGVSYERGMEIADRIHRSGRAVVWSGVRELAEHYHAQLGGLRPHDGAAGAGLNGSALRARTSSV